MTISVKDLSVSFGPNAKVLDRISFDVAPGEFVVLVGPSGCGKSTVLNALASLLSPEEATLEGEIWIEGERVDFKGRKRGQLGYVFQKDNLFPWRTVRQNVHSGMEIMQIPKGEREQRGSELIAMAGLEGFEDYYPHQISGGMRQRASLIRTLAYDPHLILMDEPFGALDAQTRMTLQAELIRIWTGSSKTVVFVTHDLTEALTLGERIIVMSKNPGRIAEIYPVDIPHPRDPFSLFGSDAFTALQTQIWRALQDEYREGPGDAAAGATRTGGSA